MDERNKIQEALRRRAVAPDARKVDKTARSERKMASGVGKLPRAAAWLRVFLGEHAIEAAVVFRAGEQMGLGAKTLRRAAKAMGVVHRRVAEPGQNSGAGYWTWELP